ncbi:DUF6171 family protein (plasmid) [Leptospira interrogans]|uniref:Uncharacterized protein n=3 Tax=Leptospira interrogans TaxID=173 RepID=A0A0E2D5B4_LEPIR|nr:MULTISPECIES: DUF6171 family protein [Leptospira]EMN28082.1 hypothetical protein LEP1GSC083_0126 [Leptospira interrogans serovar Pyrogenes str. L0374]EKR55197.1 hypothetical protein LEP1GSC105_0052 [Leptospira interrogans str. UI 12758]EMJ34072.1 hypothetical protein LEP1GSC079_5205 [Leptospira interrogans str. FPW1039]EMN34215.1 hypothetical protein LEP1GSC084_1654 [Leptospira interrogans serovar Medanensis str. L0448]EMN95901.1 hypothetical protein LEP1GSC110_0801 [Leptospira interrogans 
MIEKKDLDHRLEICLSCSLLLKGFLSERCSVCGCFVRLKTKLKQESCPIKKWM